MRRPLVNGHPIRALQERTAIKLKTSSLYGEIREDSAAEQLERDLAGKIEERRRKRAAGPALSAVKRSAAQACELVQGGEWTKLAPRHFVGLYAWLHEQVYGVDAAPELVGEQGKRAMMAVGSMLKRDFGGNPQSMADFVIWTWKRERAREQRRREQGSEGSRLTWRFAFGKSILADYRLFLSRRGGAPAHG